MHADAAKLLWDARRALQRIKRFVARKDFATYQSDELPRIVAFRNILIHGYASVDDRLVWGVVESRIEPLLDVIAVLLPED